VGATALVVVMATVQLDPRRLGSGVYRYRHAELNPETKVLFYRDGKTATIGLTAHGSEVTLATNGKPDATIEMDTARPPVLDEITMVMLGALPLAFNPDAHRVANIGLGAGLTTHTLLADEAIEHVDTVEIEAAVAVAARGFGDRVKRTFEDPRSALHVEDAKTFFSQQKNRYDVIVAEPSNPWVSGVASLFSDEFYRSIGQYLSDEGVFVQWLQLYEFNDDLASSVLKSLAGNFSDYAIFNTDNADVMIVAKRSGRLPDPDFRRLFVGPLAAELARVGIKGPDDLLVRKTGSKEILDAMLADSRVPPNSDYFPFLDLNAGKARYQASVATLFYSSSILPMPLLEMLGVAKVRFAGVTPDESFWRTRLIGDARKRLAALRGDATGDALRGTADAKLANSLLLLRASCAQGFEQTWTDALHQVARETLPYLDADAAAELLKAAAPVACRDRYPAEVSSWLDLYGAVAARDGHRMAELGERLLAAQGTNELRYFALSAAMLGHLATHAPELAARLYDQHRDVAGDLSSSPEIRLMLALANSSRELNTTAAPRALL
jgi:hypothetical protein